MSLLSFCLFFTTGCKKNSEYIVIDYHILDAKTTHAHIELSKAAKYATEFLDLTVYVPEKDGNRKVTSVSFSSDCIHVSKIVLSKYINYINGDILNDCEYLQEIEVDKDNETYTSHKGVLFTKDKKELVYYPSYYQKHVSFRFPSEIEKIGDQAFYECETLIGITISSSIKYIGNEAFEGCKNLETVDFLSDSILENIGYEAFSNCEKLKSFNIPSKVNYIGDYAFSSCEQLSVVTFPDPCEITAIGSGAFYHTAITSITIPNTITKIGSSAFRGCSKLTNIIIDENSALNVIESDAFSDTAISSIIIPDTVTILGNYVFHNCFNLKEVKLPSTLIFH